MPYLGAEKTWRSALTSLKNRNVYTHTFPPIQVQFEAAEHWPFFTRAGTTQPVPGQKIHRTGRARSNDLREL